jgi:hypothetical protein
MDRVEILTRMVVVSLVCRSMLWIHVTKTELAERQLSFR